MVSSGIDLVFSWTFLNVLPSVQSPSHCMCGLDLPPKLFSQAPYSELWLHYTPLKQTNKPSLPCPRTAGLTPCTPPAQRTGSTPSPSWPVEIYSPHSSSGPRSSWRAPSPSCSVPEAAKVDARRRRNLRRRESKGTAAGSSLLALAVCEVLVPGLKSSDESWATLKRLAEVSSGDWVRPGAALPGEANPKNSFPWNCQHPTQRFMEVITCREETHTVFKIVHGLLNLHPWNNNIDTWCCFKKVTGPKSFDEYLKRNW